MSQDGPGAAASSSTAWISPGTVAYFIWLGNLAQLDLGRSFSYKQDVTKIIGERIGPTLLLSGHVVAAGLSAGHSAWACGSRPATARLEERAASTVLYMLYSLPVLRGGAVPANVVLCASWAGCRCSACTSDDYDQMSLLEQAWDLFKHCLMPVTCLTYGSLAYRQPLYSRQHAGGDPAGLHPHGAGQRRRPGARAGAPCLSQHADSAGHAAWACTCLPILGGAVIIEQIFSWPGMGSLFFESIRTRDYQRIMGLTVMFSVLTLAGQLLADMLYALVDPRVTYS